MQVSDPEQQSERPRRTFLFDQSPRFVAGIVFGAGVLALITAVMPASETSSGLGLLKRFPDLPSYLGVFGGLALMTVSLGLVRRLRPAWVLALAAGIHGAGASALHHGRIVEPILFGLLVILLVVTRKAFYRRSAIRTLVPPLIWILTTLLAIAVMAFAALLWASHEVGFAEASFHQLIFDKQLGTAGRPVVFALLLLALGLLFVSVAKPQSLRPLPPGDQAHRTLQTAFFQSDAARPDNVLAFSRDKRLHFGPGETAALAYAELGGSWIAMGPPIGPREHWAAAIETFHRAAEAQGATTAIYSVPPDLLPDLIELGYKVEKIGENAVLDLPDFSLSGRRRETIRRGRRKLAERQGATFSMSLPPHDPKLLERLRPVSDAWLAKNGGREKAFSLGRFEPDFLSLCALGWVEINGQIVAFGTLLTTPDQSWAGIDLMRYDPALNVTNLMDFLLVELVLWAKHEGYEKFDLAMAPLAGLNDEAYAPLFARIGNFVFERGERFFNFQGLRRFKQKFDPVWEPRYLAAPGYWTLPVILAKVALLTNGQGARMSPKSSEPPMQPSVANSE